MKTYLLGLNAEEAFRFVVEPTEPGGIYGGFSIATGTEVAASVQSAGIETATSDFAMNESPMQVLIQLLGSELNDPQFNTFALGLLADFSVQVSPRGIASLIIVRPLSAKFAIGVDGPDRFEDIKRFFLYQDVVPEPSSLVLCSIGLLLLSGRAHSLGYPAARQV